MADSAGLPSIPRLPTMLSPGVATPWGTLSPVHNPGPAWESQHCAKKGQDTLDVHGAQWVGLWRPGALGALCPHTGAHLQDPDPVLPRGICREAGQCQGARDSRAAVPLGSARGAWRVRPLGQWAALSWRAGPAAQHSCHHLCSRTEGSQLTSQFSCRLGWVEL